MRKWEIGIDEAGRGPLAGPVAVGAVLVPTNFDWDLIPGVGDSKQLSAKKRKALFRRVKELQKLGQLDFAVSMVSAGVIDARGVVFAINSAMAKTLAQLRARKDLALNGVVVKLDGGLRAPVHYIYQETIIKGDRKEKVIGLASIMAKVTRDRYMERTAAKPQFAPYDFATHKGYGTKRHRTVIARYGFSAEHRQTYCKNIKIL